MIDIEQIYREYKPKVYGYLFHKIGNHDTSEDLSSEVFLKITSKIGTFDDTKSSLSTWIYTITRNTLYDYFRTRHEAEEIPGDIPSDENILEKICNDEMLERLAVCLENLKDRERELIVRYYYFSEPLKSIAKRLGISYSYARILHVKTLEKLKNKLNKK